MGTSAEEYYLRAVWRAMHSRCGNPRCRSFKWYGGSGIFVCPEWSDFSVFMADMAPRPTGMTLERKDNSLGYSKANCVWASIVAQARNRRNNRRVEIDGKRELLAEAADRCGVPVELARTRLSRGLPIERVLHPGVLPNASGRPKKQALCRTCGASVNGAEAAKKHCLGVSLPCNKELSGEARAAFIVECRAKSIPTRLICKSLNISRQRLHQVESASNDMRHAGERRYVTTLPRLDTSRLQKKTQKVW